MLSNILSGNLTVQDIPLLLLRIPIILIALTVHEMYTGALLMAGATQLARDMGRLSLNPLHHLDPLGAIGDADFWVRLGKARSYKRAPVQKSNIGMALSALAGPVSNTLLAFSACCFCAYCTFSCSVHRAGGLRFTLPPIP